MVKHKDGGVEDKRISVLENGKPRREIGERVRKTKKDCDVEIACHFLARRGRKSIKESGKPLKPTEECMHRRLVVMCAVVVVVGLGGAGEGEVVGNIGKEVRVK